VRNLFLFVVKSLESFRDGETLELFVQNKFLFVDPVYCLLKVDYLSRVTLSLTKFLCIT
jgi:hypothetical protein